MSLSHESLVKVISSEPFDHTTFEVDDFYDTAFSFGLNSILLYFKEDAIDSDTFVTMLSDDDYVKLTIECNGEEYTIYHCFAGDNPSGLITKGNVILEQIGEALRPLNILHSDPNVELIEKWYCDTTNNYQNYEHNYWYAKETQ